MIRTVYQVHFTDNRTGFHHDAIVSLRSGYSDLGDIPKLIGTMGKSEGMVTYQQVGWNRSSNPDEFIIWSIDLQDRERIDT